jgi:hypothetical protein
MARWAGRIIGRDEPLAELRARFERVVNGPAPGCVVITGEPGIGRSRLVSEFSKQCPAGTRVLHVQCAPTADGGARWPIASLIETVVGLDPYAPADVVGERLDNLFAGQPDVGRVIPQLTAMLALDGRVHADGVRWALRRVLELGADDAPTLIHVDDVDRAGAGFVRLLADVASAI